jgi:sigma-B regulation protein RsbU (phosphoserine phosphatase)
MIHLTSLPRMRGPLIMEPERNAMGSHARRSETVLVIEDDDTMRLALGCMIAADHRQVVLAHSADNALERLELVDPDIILCDYLLDGMNGRDFCRTLKASSRWRHVPIIMVTRLDAESVVADLLDSGADDVLIKPVRAIELRARLQCGLRARARNHDRPTLSVLA